MKVDLRELDVAPGESVRLPAKLGLGQLIVAVPSGVCVTGHAEAKGGELLVRGESNSGASPEFDRGGPAPGSKLPQVEIDAELQFGQLVVTDRDPDEFGGDRGGPAAMAASPTRSPTSRRPARDDAAMKAAQLGSLASGLAVTLFGVLLLLHEEGALDIDGGWLAAALTALAGLALLASGLGAREP